jgi:glycosyltransferase involved in cell wall biosynthesis
MRLLVVSTLYPPFAIGGYELECAAVAEHLAQRHDVLVLTSAAPRTGDQRPGGGVQPGGAAQVSEIRRELALLTPDERGALRAPLAALRAVRTARRALDWSPDFIYVWNGASVPHAAIRVLADSGVPLAFRVCEHWFGGLFLRDQFLRELLPADRGLAHAAWAGGARALNRLPSLRLDPTAPMRTALSWNSEALRRMVHTPPFLETVLERTEHAVPPHGDLYAAVERRPSEEPEIAFVGRITPYKGVAIAIEALALLRSRHNISARLVLAGPEDEGHARDLRLLADRLGVAEALRWPGPLAPEGVAELLARASAMIVPSTWDEPLGLVAIEGAFARVPLVASNVGGIGEAMHDEEHALLFPGGDADAAASALTRALRETEQTSARVERAYERAQAFRLSPYLKEQERFVLDALDALRGAGSRP